MSSTPNRKSDVVFKIQAISRIVLAFGSRAPLKYLYRVSSFMFIRFASCLRLRPLCVIMPVTLTPKTLLRIITRRPPPIHYNYFHSLLCLYSYYYRLYWCLPVVLLLQMYHFQMSCHNRSCHILRRFR